MLRTPFKLLSRSLPLMLGTAGMVYDMSLMSKQMESIADSKSSQASESIREMATEMETSLEQILSFKTIEEARNVTTYPDLPLQNFSVVSTDSISDTESDHDNDFLWYL